MSRFLKSIAKIKKAAALRAMPPAIICKPLQFIRERTMVQVTNPSTGHTHWENGPEYRRARIAADRGDGGHVKLIARAVAAIEAARA